MELFDYIKVLFNSNDLFEKEVTGNDMKRNFFMSNRFMSIQYPIQASFFNKLGISSVGVANSWRMVGKGYSRTPGWIFTKTKSVKTDKWKPDDNAKMIFCKKRQIGDRDFKAFYELDPEFVKEQIKRIEKHLDDEVKKEKSK